MLVVKAVGGLGVVEGLGVVAPRGHLGVAQRRVQAQQRREEVLAAVALGPESVERGARAGCAALPRCF